MSGIYPVSNDKRIIIYGISKFIYLRTVYADGIARPIMLASDYKGCLTECVFEEKLYYAYKNTADDIIVKNVMSSSVVYEIASAACPDVSNPKLTVFENRLVLFYMMKNPLTEEFSLKYICITDGDIWHTDMQNVQAASIEYTVMENVSDSVYYVWECGEALYLKCRNSLYVIEQIGHQYEIKNNTEDTAEYEARIKEQELIIESIKNQYEELRQTAISYRDEAIKWRSKFL